MPETASYSTELQAVVKDIQEYGNPDTYFGFNSADIKYLTGNREQGSVGAIILGLTERREDNTLEDDLAILDRACGAGHGKETNMLKLFRAIAAKDKNASPDYFQAVAYVAFPEDSTLRDAFREIMLVEGGWGAQEKILEKFSLGVLTARALRIMTWLKEQPDFDKTNDLSDYYQTASEAGKIPAGDIERMPKDWGEEEKLAEIITIKDTDGKVITDSQGQRLEFDRKEENGETRLTLIREVVPVDDFDPETNYSFKTFADFQTVLNVIMDRYPVPGNNLIINLRSQDLRVSLNKITNWLLCSSKNSRELEQALSMYPEGVVPATNWGELFERFGWEVKPSSGPPVEEEKPGEVEKSTPDDDIIMF